MKGVLICVFFLLFVLGSGDSSYSLRTRCESLVRRWSEKELWAMEEAEQQAGSSNKWVLQDLLFFLHVPRTGGRNYNQCFLKNLFALDQLCPRSYDKLRLVDLSKPNCSLLSTHDDYSILTLLPRAKTSTVTNMRDPRDRVLSSYEFSVEVASRFLRRGNTLTRRVNVGPKVQSMSTLDIWPWKYLVPLMQRDLFDRRDMRVSGSISVSDKSSNIYDVPSHVMPLKDFIEHPAVHELVHNGETFQIAGITNNSYLSEANEIRSCIAQYEDLGDYVLRVAKRRLDGMLYVGLTEKHKESAEILVHLVGRQVATRNLKNGEEIWTNQTYPDYLQSFNGTGNDTPYEEFINQMVTSYEKCSSTLRNAQVHRRITSLEPVGPVNFTKEARKTIPDDVMARILQLNSLDYELYQYAESLFKMEQEYLRDHAEDLKRLQMEMKPTLTLVKEATMVKEVGEQGELEDSAVYIYWCLFLFSLLGMILLVKAFEKAPTRSYKSSS